MAVINSFKKLLMYVAVFMITSFLCVSLCGIVQNAWVPATTINEDGTIHYTGLSEEENNAYYTYFNSEDDSAFVKIKKAFDSIDFYSYLEPLINFGK